MHIREYRASDKDALVEITLRAWEPVFAGMKASMSADIYAVFVPDWRAEQLRSINTVCDSEDVELMVAEQEGEIVGFSAIKLHPEDYLGEIYMIAVDPRHQQQGFGSVLMEDSLERIKRSGLQLAMVETGGDPGHAAARRTYEKMGFENWPVARYLKRL